MCHSWSFNVNKNANDFIEIGARLSYPCTHLRWDVSYTLHDSLFLDPLFLDPLFLGPFANWLH